MEVGPLQIALKTPVSHVTSVPQAQNESISELNTVPAQNESISELNTAIKRRKKGIELRKRNCKYDKDIADIVTSYWSEPDSFGVFSPESWLLAKAPIELSKYQIAITLEDIIVFFLKVCFNQSFSPFLVQKQRKSTQKCTNKTSKVFS